MMSPRFEAPPFWQFLQRHSTPPRPFRTISDTDFGLHQNCPNSRRNPCPIWTEFGVRIAVRIQCPINSEIPVRITPKYAGRETADEYGVVFCSRWPVYDGR